MITINCAKAQTEQKCPAWKANTKLSIRIHSIVDEDGEDGDSPDRCKHRYYYNCPIYKMWKRHRKHFMMKILTSCASNKEIYIY